MSLSFVFDTNVVISASLFRNSILRQALDWARLNGDILLSQAIIDELEDVFHRDKFDRYITKEKRLLFLKAITNDAHLIEPAVSLAVCRDPKDNKFLELAVTIKATCIVSSDGDLLTLHPFQDIPIVNPATLLETDWTSP